MTRAEELKHLIAEGERLKARAEQIQAEKQQAKLTQTLERIKATADLMAHETFSAPYITFMESKAYVDGLRDKIKEEGREATDAHTGRTATVKLAADGHSLQTFDDLREGQTIEVSGKSFFVVEWQPSFAGSKAVLLPANRHVTVGERGKPVTPYSGKAAHWNQSENKLTVSKRDAVASGEIINLDGKQFRPVASFLVAPAKGLVSYELAPVEEAK